MARLNGGFYEFTKDKDALLDFSFDLTSWLQTNETLVAVKIDPVTSPDALMIIGDGAVTCDTGYENNVTLPDVEIDTTSFLIWVGAGTLGNSYEIIFHYKTNQGRYDDVNFRITIT